MKEAANLPQKEFRAGAVRAAVWSNIRRSPDGRSFNAPKVLVERVYKDSQGTFQTTNSLDTNDIPKAILVLKKAYEYLLIRNLDSAANEQDCFRDAGELVP